MIKEPIIDLDVAKEHGLSKDEFEIQKKRLDKIEKKLNEVLKKKIKLKKAKKS